MRTKETVDKDSGDEKLQTQTDADDDMEAGVSEDSEVESDRGSEDHAAAGETESVTTKRSKTSRVTIKSPAESKSHIIHQRLKILEYKLLASRMGTSFLRDDIKI